VKCLTLLKVRNCRMLRCLRGKEQKHRIVMRISMQMFTEVKLRNGSMSKEKDGLRVWTVIDTQKFIGRNVKEEASTTYLLRGGRMKVKYIGKAKTIALKKEKVYDVLSVEKGWFRIMTELDDDYLFPPDQFEVIEEDSDLMRKRAIGK